MKIYINVLCLLPAVAAFSSPSVGRIHERGFMGLTMTERSTETAESTSAHQKTSDEVDQLLQKNQEMVQQLKDVAPELTDVECLRFAMQFDSFSDAESALRERLRWSQAEGKAIVDAAQSAVAEATSSSEQKWNNDPVYASAPHADVINEFITPKAVMTLSTDDGDLIYVIRASQIDDKALMDRVSIEELGDYFLYAKEIHQTVANQRSAATGRLCNVIFANDISGVRKAPDGRFSKALTSSSDQYETLYPSLAGPTMILNLPFVLQAFVGLLKPLFPKSVQKRLVFTRAPVLKSLETLTPLAEDATTRQKFVAEVKSLLPN